MTILTKSKAFSFIEILIYLQATAIIFLLLSNFGLNIAKKFDLVRSELDGNIRVALACDLIYRDLLSGAGEIAYFEDNIFRKKYFAKKMELVEKDIAWKVVGERLTRTEGLYDYRSKKWKDKVVSFAGNNFKDLKMEPDLTTDKKNIKGVWVTLCLNRSKAKEFYVLLQNKIY